MRYNWWSNVEIVLLHLKSGSVTFPHLRLPLSTASKKGAAKKLLDPKREIIESCLSKKGKKVTWAKKGYHHCVSSPLARLKTAKFVERLTDKSDDTHEGKSCLHTNLIFKANWRDKKANRIFKANRVCMQIRFLRQTKEIKMQIWFLNQSQRDLSCLLRGQLQLWAKCDDRKILFEKLCSTWWWELKQE